jgi:DNA-3-methyladenine glycosylase II
MIPAYIPHLLKDKKLKKVLEAHQPIQLRRNVNICLELCSSIMSQQLSTRVAEVIYRRFLALYGSIAPEPQQILDTPPETLRSIGLSNAKTNYVHNVARFAIEHGLDIDKIDGMNNSEVIEYLTRIKGVGNWTVEMLLMFTLGREDVFAVDDLGIQNAMISLYKLDRSDKKKFREDMLRISLKWKPYRTYACLHLWKWKDAGA